MKTKAKRRWDDYMKNKISIELTFISLILSSCGAHQHTFNDFWSYDDTSHWHDASCEHKDEIIDVIVN